MVIMHSHIGIGTPLHDDHKAHGAPVGPAFLAEEVVGPESFGRSGRGPDLYRLFGLTPEAVAAAAMRAIASSAVPQR